MRTVLVIDDERPTLSMFGLLLEGMGYEVLTAASGREGIEVFERERPAIVFTDIKMPDMDGLEVLSGIKTRDPSAEVIVVTGHGDVELALSSLNLDAADFIDKPIRSEALSRALARAEERLNLKAEASEQVGVRELEGATVIEVGGKLSSSLEAAMDQAASKAAGRGLPVAVSLDPAATLTGAGIALLARVMVLCGEAGLSFHVAAPSGAQRDVLGAAGIFAASEIRESLDDALAAMGRASAEAGGA